MPRNLVYGGPWGPCTEGSLWIQQERLEERQGRADLYWGQVLANRSKVEKGLGSLGANIRDLVSSTRQNLENE